MWMDCELKAVSNQARTRTGRTNSIIFTSNHALSLHGIHRERKEEALTWPVHVQVARCVVAGPEALGGGLRGF